MQQDTRQLDQSFRWAEKSLGGRITARHQHERWRPQWFLDFQDGALGRRRALMRGFRNPGYATTDERGARAMLKIEASMLRTLQNLPVRVPRFFAYDEAGGWILMECVSGESELTSLADDDLKHSIFREYMEEIAKLHSLPLNSFKIPEGMFVPKSYQDIVDRFFGSHVALYRSRQRRLPEPLLELGIRWLQANPLRVERPMALGLGDIGPNQFLFENGHFKTLLDFEYGNVADPLMEIGLMRFREMTYPIGRMGEHIRHYSEHCRKLTGETIDLDIIRYWTTFGAVVWPLLFNGALQNPDPAIVDLTFLFAHEVHQRRCIAESLAEQHEITLVTPELPPETVTYLTPLYELFVGQQALAMGAPTPNSMVSRYSMSVAQSLARSNTIQSEIDRANIEELSALLGFRPKSILDGMRTLEEAVSADYQKDFEKRVQFLYRFEIRREFIYEPMQIATGVGVRSPLWRI